MKPYEDIRDSIGIGTMYNIDGKSYTIDENYLHNLEIQEHFFYEYAYADNRNSNTYALFGTNDELFSHIEDFKKYFDESKMRTIPVGHELKENELHMIIDFIREIER